MLSAFAIFFSLQIDENVQREIINHRSLRQSNIIRFREDLQARRENRGRINTPMECQRSKRNSEKSVGQSSPTMGRESTTNDEELLNKSSPSNGKMGLLVEGYPVEGLSIGGQETCVIFPSLRIAFDIGRCPQRAISQDYLFISHGHLDHIGGLPMYVATRGLYRMKPPTIFVPDSIKEIVERLFDVHRAMDQSELKHNLIGMNVGDEFQIRKDLKVKSFRTHHVIPSQGYIIYSVKQKLKKEYITLSGNEIKDLRLSGVEVTYTVTSPEIAFTGDTMSDFVVDPDNSDVLKARILVMEDLSLKKTIGGGVESGGLYYLTPDTSYALISIVTPYRWHYCLGHLSARLQEFATSLSP